MGLIIGGTVLVALALWAVIAPRQQWWLLTAWRYRDPDANEPSDLAYHLTRAAGVGTIVVVLVLGWQLIDFERSPEKAAADARAARAERFGVSSARLTSAPPAVANSSLGRVPLLRYATVGDSSDSADLLAGLGTVPPGTNLIVAVDGAHEARTMTVAETASSVTVTLHGGCSPTAPRIICDPADPVTARSRPLPPVRLFPVTLARPLGSRSVVDGSTGTEAIGR
ncbi:DUF6199 family natural product biosynthesis protein [Cryptosporangium arvum]|uniref:DUF6199 family natural product biosynthesis protein n=1 Tax=Cryptosporangium arvum TaxID=80871 RepID=UPI0004AE58F1|nr:DUF6199 family natural product biosynthesis protein [Cryptosporangium arvum]